MRRSTDKFAVRADDGEELTVIEYQVFSIFNSLTGTREVPGMKDYQLSDGRDVNWIDENNFEIVRTGRRLRRI